MQPRVSIIIPVYNGEKYIRNSIIKLQKQTYTNLEVIYVDDGSTDQTGVILDETAMEDDRFRVIHKENGGVSAARNTGINRAVILHLINDPVRLTADLDANFNGTFHKVQTVKNTVFNNGLNDKLQHMSLFRLFLHFDTYLDPTAKAVKNNFGVFPDICYLLFHRNNIMAFNSITENP